MKKLVKILVPFLCISASLLSACGKDDNGNKIMLSFGDLNATDVVDLEVGDIQSKIKNKESFMLAVSSNTCACWLDFHPIIKSYVTENHLYCAHTTYNDFKDYASTYGIQLSSSSTTFVIFEDGVAKIKIMSSAEDKKFKDLNTFKSFMNDAVTMPKMYLINEDNAKAIKSSEKNAVIYFERTKCDDCGYINQTLTDYYKSHKDAKTMYVLDCQPWKLLTNEQYQAKKDEFGISAANNPTYGANIGTDKGVFPFFSYISNGNYASGAVAFNDTITKVNDKYVVTNSYYSAERTPNLDYTDKVLVGTELSASDVSDNGVYAKWDNDKAIAVYKPIITSFLDSKLPLTNFTF